MSRAPKSPSLPQNDSPSQQEARNKQLAEAQDTYQWTRDSPTLTGLPLAADVPKENRPTDAWWLEVLEVGARVAANAVEVALSGAASASVGASSKESAGKSAKRVGAIRESLVDLRGDLNPDEHPIGDMFERLAERTGVKQSPSERLESHRAELERIVEQHRVSNGTASTLADYEALFKALPLPALASNFMEDDTFAMLRVAGPNPMLIRNVRELPAHFPVTEQDYQHSMGAQDTLETALSEGRVFLLDYQELSSLQPSTWEGLDKVVYAPLALFAVPKGGTRLTPVAIQCDQDPSEHPIFLPVSDGPGMWGWQMARDIVQVADGNYHELFAHLARTHLVQEAFAMATYRQLASSHPLNALLTPHFEGTLFINNAAAGGLIAPGGPIDEIFGGTISSTQRAAVADRLAFDFDANRVPVELEARGVGTDSALRVFPYRDDALLVWGALEDWVHQYVYIYYSDDQAVLDDTELEAWHQDVVQQGAVKGFARPLDRESLVQAITMVIWNGSAQHAAVNFPQKWMMTYSPALTGASWASAPSRQNGHTKPDWLAAMPPLSLANLQLDTLTLLGSVYYRPLGDYRSNDFPYRPWFRDSAVTDNALPRFQAALAQVEATINARNSQRRYEYAFLKPSAIPSSINI